MRKVKIEDIVNELELVTDEGKSFMNTTTGELFHMSDVELEYAKVGSDGQTYNLLSQSEKFQIAVGIFRSGQYIQLPTKDKINEYGMMRKYISSISDGRILNDVKKLTNDDNNDFWNLRDIILKYNMGEGWYKYKRKEFRGVAIEWCKRYFDEMPASIQTELKNKNRFE